MRAFIAAGFNARALVGRTVPNHNPTKHRSCNLASAEKPDRSVLSAAMAKVTTPGIITYRTSR
jgi:hypothetical protein